MQPMLDVLVVACSSLRDEDDDNVGDEKERKQYRGRLGVYLDVPGHREYSKTHTAANHVGGGGSRTYHHYTVPANDDSWFMLW